MEEKGGMRITKRWQTFFSNVSIIKAMRFSLFHYIKNINKHLRIYLLNRKTTRTDARFEVMKSSHFFSDNSVFVESYTAALSFSPSFFRKLERSWKI